MKDPCRQCDVLITRCYPVARIFRYSDFLTSLLPNFLTIVTLRQILKFEIFKYVNSSKKKPCINMPLSHLTIKEFGGHRCYQKSPYANEKASARCFRVAL